MLKKVQNMLMKVLNHKLVFIALVLLSVLNVVGYAMVRSYNCLGIFAGTAVVVHLLTKHNALALLAAIFVANFVFSCSKVKESMSCGDKKKEPMENQGEEEEKEGLDMSKLGNVVGELKKMVPDLQENSD
tara:strand:+ start:580 stop:969 length:390 start_codon:yes stop_codon:yes gene_type:complete